VLVRSIVAGYLVICFVELIICFVEFLCLFVQLLLVTCVLTLFSYFTYES
jgi:hypothetical protein